MFSMLHNPSQLEEESFLFCMIILILFVLYQITLISVFILFYGKLLIIFCHVSLPYPPTPSPILGEGEP